MLKLSKYIQDKSLASLLLVCLTGLGNCALYFSFYISWLANGASILRPLLAASMLFIIIYILATIIFAELADQFASMKLLRITKCMEPIHLLISMLAIYLNHAWLLTINFCLTAIFLALTRQSAITVFSKYSPSGKRIQQFAFFKITKLVVVMVGIILGISSFRMIPHFPYLLLLPFLFTVLSLVLSFNLVPEAEIRISHPLIVLNPVNALRNLKSYLTDHHEILLNILGIAWFWLITGSTFILLFYTLEKYVARTWTLLGFLAIFIIGLIVGAKLCTKALKGKISTKFVPFSMLAQSICLLDLSFAVKTIRDENIIHLFSAPDVWRIAIDVFLIANFAIFYYLPLYTSLQTAIEDKWRNRIVAASQIINILAVIAISSLIVLLHSLTVTYSALFFLITVLNFFVAIYICKLLPHALIQSYVKWLFQLLYKVQVKGLENYEKAGKRVVIIVNHTSFLDVPLLAAFLPDKFIFAVNTYIAEKWWMKPLLSLVDVFNVDPTNLMAMKPLIRAVQADRKCIIFPEGRITVTGSLMKIYEGPGMIADKADALILPIRIDGAHYSVFSRLRGKIKLRWFPKITLTILPPQRFSADDTVKGRERRENISGKLYEIMTNMLFTSSNYRTTLFASLLEASKLYGRYYKIAEDIQRKPISYHQLITRSLILGKVIAQTTTEHESVGILLPNTGAVLIVFFAVQAVGRVAAMLNYTSGAHNILHACKLANIKFIYTSHAFIEAADLQPIISHLVQEQINIIYLEDLRNQISSYAKLQGLVLAKFAPDYYLRKTQISPQQAAVILFTSGSEGKPKGVVLSHENIQANRYQVASVVPFTMRDKIFNALPIFHSFGLTMGSLLPIFSGVKTFFYPSPLHFRIVPELVYEIDATILLGTDTFLTGYAHYAHPYDFYSLQYIFAGAERVKEKTQMQWLDKFGIRIFEGYGTTETAPVLAVNTPMHFKRGTVGRLLPGIEYKLEPVPGIKEGGKLWVKGPNTMLGYLSADKPGEIQALPEGWYDTGDIVSVDEDGYVLIQGRAKRFAKIAGEMISLAAIEDYVLEIWPSYQHAAVNLPDPKRGEKIILITTHPEATREEIVKFVKDKGYSELTIPHKIIYIETMPLLGSGKINYIAVREWLMTRTGGD